MSPALAVIFAFTIITFISWLVILVRYLDSLTNIPSLKDYTDDSEAEVAAIIPVRDDIADNRVERLLEDNFVKEIIIVNDNSSVSNYDGLMRLKAKSKLVNVCNSRGEGKAIACQTGADISRKQLLLFLDADTWVERGAIAKACKLMKVMRLDALSVIGKLRCSELDKILTPFNFALLNALFPLKKVMDKRSSGFFFGSFILIKRDSYYKIGGHLAVQGKILEDKALGQHAKKEGLKIAIANAERLVSAEWAPGSRQNIQALKRVIAPSMSGKRKSAIALTVAMSFLLLMSLISLPFGYMNHLILLVNFLSLLTQLFFCSIACNSIGVNPIYSIGFPIAEIMLCAVFWKSFLASVRHEKISWKGRECQI